MSPERLRPLNAPRRVEIEVGPDGLPVAVGPSDRRLSVASIRDSWRLDDEWWRVPIRRRYVDLILAGGGRMVVFEDLVSGEWWTQ